MVALLHIYRLVFLRTMELISGMNITQKYPNLRDGRIFIKLSQYVPIHVSCD